MSSVPKPLETTDYATKFSRDGFIVVDRLIDDAAVDEIADVYDRILAREIDCGSDDADLGRMTRQVMFPSKHHTLFRDNAALAAAKPIAAEALGCADPVPVFDMLIYKPPLHPHDTPWHQDMAYAGMPFAPAGTPIPSSYIMQFWMPLEEVDETTGCMHFVPGAHSEPLLPHVVAGGSPEESTRLLAIDNPAVRLDLDKAVACPLKRGGATAHGYGTPHYTSPNRSPTRHRRAYIFNFADPSRIDLSRRGE